MNKKKIINDPVYGFITIPSELIYDLISHPYFQRLRYIKQLGMTHLVYPGALHTRFHHALGAMHLMGLALEVLRSKGHPISFEEEEAATIAILLHDIGHGPFSHALEHTLVNGIQHEDISMLMMDKLNEEFNGQMSERRTGTGDGFGNSRRERRRLYHHAAIHFGNRASHLPSRPFL